MVTSDAHATDDADPGQPDDRLIALAAAYDEALAQGEPSREVASWDHALDDDSRAQLERNCHVLERLARVRREVTPTAQESESGEQGSWFGLSWPKVSSAEVVLDESHLPRRLGRFEIVRELGRGGHGVVLLARDPVLNREVALKVPRPEALLTTDARRRFAREAQATARLQHPNLVPVYEVGEFGPICYIASAYCDGPTLAAWLAARGKPMAPRRAAAWVAAIARAVHYAHTQGVLHRDLKPGNVLLARKCDAADAIPVEENEGQNLEPLVTDFGLAKLTQTEEAHTRTGTVLGTPAYMAPEQADGRLGDVGPAADVYALGTILFELSIGRPPFLAQSDIETLRQISQEEPLPLRRLQPKVPLDLETICLTCLEKNPARRYASASALADDLERFLNGEPITVRPPSIWRRARLWIGRHPAQAVAVAAVSAVAIGVPAGISWHSIQVQQERALAVRARDLAEQSARVAIENQARVQQHVYVADMRVAQQLRQEGDLVSLTGFLDRYQPRDGRSQLGPAANSHLAEAATETRGDVAEATARNARGFEWHYLDRFRDIIRLRLHAHTGDIDLLAFSARSDVLATACMKEGLVRVWEIPSGSPLATFTVRKSPTPRAMEEIAALSPNGDRVATLIDPQTVIVWDVQNHAELVRLRHEHTIHTVAFTSDGAQLVGGGDKETLVWNVQTGQVASTYPAARLVATSPDGRELGLVDVPVAANQTSVWDMPTGVAERQFEWPGAVRQVRYSPDGTMLASLVDYPLWSHIYVTDPHSGVIVQAKGGRGERYSHIGFSGDSSRLVAVAADGSLRFWDSQSGMSLGALRGPAKRFSRFAFSSDNCWLATAEPGGSVLVWDGQLLRLCDELVPSGDVVGPIIFSPDGKTLAAAIGDRTVLLVDVVSNRADVRLPAHADLIRDLCFSPDGQQVLTTDGQSVTCFKRGDGTQVWSINTRIKYLAWSAQLPVIAVGGYDNSVRLHNPDNGSEVRNLDGFGRAELTGMRMVPKSTLLAATNGNSDIYFWDLSSRKLVHSQKLDAAVQEFLLSADGSVLAAGMKTGELRVWSFPGSPNLEEPLFRLAWPGGRPSSFTLSADGKEFGFGGFFGIFQALRVPTSEHVYTLSGRRVGGTAAAYSPDGQTLATVSRTGCLTFWNLADWRTRTLDGSPLLAARSLAFSPDGSSLAVGIDDAVASDQLPIDNLPVAPNVRKFMSRSAQVALPSSRSVSFDERPWNVSDCGFRLWDVSTTRERSSIGKCSTLTATPLVAWSRRGMIAAGSDDGTVWIWNSNTQELAARVAAGRRSAEAISWESQPNRVTVPQSMLKQLDGVVALAFSLQGDRLAVATRQGAVQLVDADDWDHQITLCTDATDVACLAFSPSGSMLAANRRGQLIYWNLDVMERKGDAHRIGQEDASQVCSAVFAHDGRRLAVGRRDGIAELWDVELLNQSAAKPGNGQRQVMLKGHLDCVASMSFSPDDRTLATGGWDSTVRLWHVASGQEVAVLKAHHGKVEAVAFSPDGTVLATGGQRDADHGEVFLWRATR